MFDPSRKHWENQSLLSLIDGKENADTREAPLLAAARAAARQQPALPPHEPVGKARGTGRLHSFFDRAKRRLKPASSGGSPEPEAEIEAPATRPLERRHEVEQREEYPSFEEEENLESWRREEAPSVPARSLSDQRDAYWRPIIDPMHVVSGVTRAGRLIVLMTILGAVAGVLIALSTPKQYYSATEILFDPRDLQLSDRDLTRGNLPSDATLALIENQIGIITSSVVLNKVAERLNLADDPEFNGEGGSALGMLFNPRALFSFGGGRANPGTRTALSVQNLAEKLRVSRNDRTFIIHIGTLTENPDKSALIANTTAEVYLEQTGELQQKTANRANAELTDRLGELQKEVEATEQAVADFKAEHGIIDAQGRLITDDEIVRLNDQLATARARTAELNARASSSRGLDLGAVLGGALPEQVSSPVMTELLAQYASLRQQADRASARLGPRHPENQAVQAELAGLGEAIAGELRRVTAAMQVELQRAVQLEQDLAGRLAQLKVEKGNLENEQVKLRELEREATARRAVYESFLLRARETGQQGSLNTANASIISTAYPPLLPSGPSRASIAIAGAVLGFLAGVGIGAARGAYESLRENMGGSHPTRPTRPGSAPSGRSRRAAAEEPFYDEDDDDFDPPPDDDPPARRRRYGDVAPAAEGGQTPTRRTGPQGGTLRSELSGAAPVRQAPFHPYAAPAAAYPPPVWRAAAMQPVSLTTHANDDAEYQGYETDDWKDPSPIDHIRQSLRDFRREIDELTEQRARRRA